MTLKEISKLRLFNQKVEATGITDPAEAVRWMGAMQAQDYAMAKCAIGKRIIMATDEKVESSFSEGEIIRTHVLRPTWHFVHTEDICWMLDLTAAKIRSSMKSRDSELELTKAVFIKSIGIIEKELSRGIHLQREQIAYMLNAANIRTDDNRLSHILMTAELEKVICSGRKEGSKLTFALLAERVPVRKSFSVEESLAMLASRYFTSHGPATLKDFIWWSGLSVANATKALESVKKEFVSENVGPDTYWMKNGYPRFNENKISVHLLPAFDEFLISYRDRSASLPSSVFKNAVSNNGIFYPVILVDGQVAGVWKRTSKKNKVEIETRFFTSISQSEKELVVNEIESFGRFLGKEVKFSWQS